MNEIEDYGSRSNMLIEGAAAVIDQYNALFTRIEELELINVVDERTLLDVSLSMVYGFYP